MKLILLCSIFLAVLTVSYNIAVHYYHGVRIDTDISTIAPWLSTTNIQYRGLGSIFLDLSIFFFACFTIYDILNDDYFDRSLLDFSSWIIEIAWYSAGLISISIALMMFVEVSADLHMNKVYRQHVSASIVLNSNRNEILNSFDTFCSSVVIGEIVDQNYKIAAKACEAQRGSANFIKYCSDTKNSIPGLMVEYYLFELYHILEAFKTVNKMCDLVVNDKIREGFSSDIDHDLGYRIWSFLLLYFSAHLALLKMTPPLYHLLIRKSH